MPHVVTQPCCADASCVHACPVNCIRPTPDDPDFATAEMLHIDPQTCVDCGACVPACPVGAIVPDSRLAPVERLFSRINEELSAEHDERSRQSGRRTTSLLAPVRRTVRLNPRRNPLRVAVVGAGPAAMYTADELLRQPGIEVTVLDRLTTPHGLARFGVAPDHRRTREVRTLFRLIEDQPGFHYALGTEVGRDLSAETLAAHVDAVVYATGASTDKRIGIPGESLPGSLPATGVVGWYNGHPDHVDCVPDLDATRVVVVGNGNVALDVARMVAGDPRRLDGSEVSPEALDALRASSVDEVVVLGRRGPAEAAFTLPELAGLMGRTDLDVRVECPYPIDPTATLPTGERPDASTSMMLELLRDHADATGAAQRQDVGATRGSRGRVVLRFHCAPVEICGSTGVTGVRVVATEPEVHADGRVTARPVPGTESVISTSTVVRAVGYHGVPVPGVPFDDVTGTIPTADGRVLDEVGGRPVPGSYAVGWIKRGPRGFLGSNKECAFETVTSLLTDANAGRLPSPRPADEWEGVLRRLAGRVSVPG